MLSTDQLTGIVFSVAVPSVKEPDGIAGSAVVKLADVFVADIPLLPVAVTRT